MGATKCLAILWACLVLEVAKKSSFGPSRCECRTADFLRATWDDTTEAQVLCIRDACASVRTRF